MPNTQICSKCTQNSVIALQHGNLCKKHFINYFEDRVFKTINRFQLLGRKEKICVATSGGKDSLTVLYLTKRFLEKNNLPTDNLFALAIDEGIRGYRENTIVDLKKFCAEHSIPLVIASFEKELGKTLDDAYPAVNKGTNKKPCNICGVWRRYLLNKYAKMHGATKVVTGHNLDDEAQAIMMNLFKANTGLAARLGPVSGIDETDFFIQRVKPLYLSPEKEVRLYALLKGFDITFTECPYTKEGYRHHIQQMLNDFEIRYKGTKQGIINSFLAMLPLLQQNQKNILPGIQNCGKCSEASNQEVCNACKIKEALENA
ncbi:MAG: TIGR00269 family protein [Nanoarchaeota archaeon]